MKIDLRLYRWVLVLCVVVLGWQISVSLPHERFSAKEVDNRKAGPSGLVQDSWGGFQKWLVDQKRGDAFSPNELAEGIQLARERMKALQQLVRTNPTGARIRLMSLGELAALPEAIRRECEQPWSARADLDLRWESRLSEDGRLICKHRHVVKAADAGMEAFGPHLLLPTLPLRGSFLQGHRLGDLLLLDPVPVRRLNEEETKIASQWFRQSESSQVDPLTREDASQGVPAVIAGNIQFFENEATLASVSDGLVAAEKEARAGHKSTLEHPFRELEGASMDAADGGDLATPYLADQINVLFIRVDFSDFPGEANSVSKTSLETSLNAVANHINQYSYGAASLVHTVTPTLYRMPSTGASYATSANGNDSLLAAAKSLAAANYTLSNYNVVAVYFPYLGGVPGSQITYGGLASVGGSNHWINGANQIGVILHEFGHNYGLFHSNYWNPSSTLGGTRFDQPNFSSVEYGDIFDTMGGGGATNGYFSPFSTRRLGWLPEGKTITPTANGTWRISRFDTPGATSNAVMALRVPMGGGVYYWVGHRKRYGTPYNLQNAAYVVAEGLYQDHPNLIDMTPNSSASATLDRQDCGLAVGAVRYDAAAGVRFETLASGGSPPNEWIDVNVQFDSRIEIVGTEFEVDEVAGFARVTLRRSFGSATAASVNYSTSQNTATAGADFHAIAGTVSWAIGDTADKVLSIPIRPDSLVEGVETLNFSLSGPVGAVLTAGTSSVTVSILDPGRRFAGFEPGFFNTSVNAIAPLSDGKVIVGGDIGSGISGAPHIRHLARLNVDGSVGSSFLTGLGFDGPVSVIRTQPDGKILLGGRFTSYDGAACNRLVRLNANGTMDHSFVTANGTGASGTVRAIEIESSGKLLVAGDFATFDGQSVKRIVRLLSSGARDTLAPLTVDAGLSVSSIYAVLALPDGKVMIGGSLNAGYAPLVDGFRSGLARLEANGSRDPGFEPGAGAHFSSSRYTLGTVRSLALQVDGKVLAAGFFERWNGTPASNLVRLNSNGAADSTFGSPTLNSSAELVLVQPSGNILVGGNFTARLLRLMASGASDPTWNPGGNPGGSVLAAAASGPSLYVGGNFFSYGGVSSRPVVRVAAGGGDAYDAWKLSRFSSAQFANGSSAPSADPDGDGLSNLLEMALGSNPGRVSGALLSPIFRTIPSGLQSYLEIEFTKGPDAAALWITGQFSDNLSTWSPPAPLPGGSSIYQIIEDSPTRLVLRDNLPISSGSKRFARFHIQRPH